MKFIIPTIATLSVTTLAANLGLIQEHPAEPLDTGEECIWISAVYGALVTCQAGWIMTGVCGSGYRADCNNGQYWYQIKCCEAGSESQKHCSIEHSGYGKSASCGSNKEAYGGCGSGKNAWRLEDQ